MEFTKEQLRAIQHPDSNLQLIACAGSGKTEVVARRVANLLRSNGGLLPQNIIAFTFTDKAAGELKERIVTRCREELGEINGMAEMYVGTIHAFCLDLLKTEVPKYLKYEVLNEIQQGLLVDRYSQRSGLTASLDLKGKALRRYLDTKHYVTALSLLREADLNDAALTGCSLMDGLAAYEGLLEEKAYLDYTSILKLAVDVLVNDGGLRERLGDRVRHVIVDEYQDVNPIQEAVVWCLHELGAKVCVVGDDDQTIYQWRGSDVQNILKFVDRYPKVTQVRLEENFRSSQGIVETARAFVEQNGERLPKAMKPTAAQTFEPGDIVALSFDTPEEEAAYIVETIQSLRGVAIRQGDGERGISYADMAILLRSVQANGEPITRALNAAGVRFIIVGMNNLFSTSEAQAARELFYFMAGRDGSDENALLRAWQAANTGATVEDLRRAVEGAAEARGVIGQADSARRSEVYAIQRVYLDFLERANIHEENVPDSRGEVLFYNLGKFSQLISDFESIHFRSPPADKYEAFADFLYYRAEDAYPEGWQSNQYASPDAVRIMTVHQAKGMQWPVVFVPALLKNRFPGKRMGGRSVWHLLPQAGIVGYERFAGTVEDERRLFYVAMTRSQKFLHLTWAPVPGNQLFQKVSQFWEDVLSSKYVKRRRQNYASRRRLTPEPLRSVANVVLSFSNFKYFFECPYKFKLQVLYGFNAPIDEALGYGKSLHDALAEVHQRAIRGDVATIAEVPRLVDTHLHAPYAYPELKRKLQQAAEKVVRDYLHDNRNDFDKIEMSEKAIEINLGDGVAVTGRIDLVRRVDTGEITIVDLKSKQRVQAEEVTEAQLHIYALGYRELVGRDADYVETYNLDERERKPRSVDEDFITDVKDNVRRAAAALRQGAMPKTPSVKTCSRCDFNALCPEGIRVIQSKK